MIEKIESLITQKGLNQRDVEAAALLPAGRISKWKGSRKSEPSLSQAIRIAKVLDVTLRDIYDDDLAGSIDDVLDVPGTANTLSAAEQYAVDIIREWNLGKQDVIWGLGVARDRQKSRGTISVAHAEPGVPPENRGRKDRGAG